MARGPSAPNPLPGIRAAGAQLGPILALGGLAMSWQLHAAALLVLAPEITESLDLGKETLAGFLAVEQLVYSIATLAAASLSRRKIRGILCAATGIVWSVAGAAGGFASRGWHLLAGNVARGMAGATFVIHPPLLLDYAPPPTRARVLSLYQGVGAAGGVVSPLVIAILAAAGLGWEQILVTAGVIALAAAVPSLGLRDPGIGRFEPHAPASVAGEESLGVFEAFHRLRLIPTVRRILVAYAVLGVALVPLTTFLLFFLEDRWGLSPGGRGVFLGAMPLFAIPALAASARRAERTFATDPALVVRGAALVLAAGALAVGGMATAPSFPLVVIATGTATAAFAVLAPLLNLILLSVVHPFLRGHASALAGLYFAGVGGLGGLLALSGVEDRLGAGAAIAALVLPGLLAAVILRSAGDTLPADLAARNEEAHDTERVAAARSAGTSLPLLSCQGVRVAYGGRDVLHGIDLEIVDGEMVALLGTNGAGKTTLLRAISGLVPVTGGAVRIDGNDLTHVDTERRVLLGEVVYVPAAEGSFADLTVAENLTLFGFRNPRADPPREVFDAFPVLAQRLDVPAGKLSGGERRMLALSQALVIRPRLLLIDELSFGVAPSALPGLIERVMALREHGATILLVEQSPAVARDVAPRAIFLHDGRVRFDGPTERLLQRDDLLRPLFLGNAAS